VLGEHCVAGGLCRISSRVDAPGRIHHMGIEPFVAFNWADGHADPRLEALRDAFTRVGVKAVIPADIAVELWLKFLFITAISGVGSLTRAPVGVKRSIPQTRRLLEDSIASTGALARARGVALPPAAEADTLRYIDGMPSATTSSMQRDITEGHPSELEMQNGAVVRLGQAAGVPTPTHAFIYAALLPLEERARGKVTF
jgi:2-dehydropantoate 2-reductase